MMRIDTAIKFLKKYYEEAKRHEWVQDKVAWALYQTWKEANARGQKK